MSHRDDINMIKVSQYIKIIRHMCDKLEKEVEITARKSIDRDSPADNK